MYKLSGFSDRSKQKQVIRECIKSGINTTFDYFLFWENTPFLKQSYEQPQFVGNEVVLWRLINSDFDGVWTRQDTPLAILKYYEKICELNLDFKNRMPKILEIVKKSQTTTDPTPYMNEYERIMHNVGLTKKQHEEGVNYAIDNTNIVPHAQESLLDFWSMSCYIQITSADIKDIILGIVNKNFSVPVPEDMIHATVKHFKTDGNFLKMDWVMGYRKSPKWLEENAKLQKFARSKFKIIVSDNRESDLPMKEFSASDYEIGINQTYWLEEAKYDESGDELEIFLPEARDDMMKFNKSVKEYDYGLMLTKIFDERLFNHLNNLGNDIRDAKNKILNSRGHDLRVLKKNIVQRSKEYVNMHYPLFDLNSSGVLETINKLSYSDYEQEIKELSENLVEILEKNSLPIRLKRNFLINPF